MSVSVEYLTEEDAVTLYSEDGVSQVSTGFRLPESEIETLLGGETLENESEVIMKVKKPDFLGNSMSELRHHDRNIQAKMFHDSWLADFQAGRVQLRPGDSIRALLRTATLYDENHEVQMERHEILEIREVLRSGDFVQLILPSEDA